MPVILVSNHYEGKPLEIIESVVPNGFSLKMLSSANQKELEKEAGQADYLLVSGRLKINREVIKKATNVKMIQRTGVGLDSLSIDEIKKAHIPIYVNKGVNAVSVAEHTILLMLASLRKLPEIDRNTKAGIWKKQIQGTNTYELRGRTVGIIGMGHIGQRVAEMLKAFNVNVIYHDVFTLDEEMSNKLNVKKVTLDNLLSESDIITLHCPLTEENRNMISENTIAKMKDEVVLINTSRGDLINEEDLASALNSGKVMYAGIDVYSEEPMKNNALLSVDNIIMTPHIGGVTYDSFRSMMKDAMRNIECFEQGRFEEIQEYKLEV